MPCIAVPCYPILSYSIGKVIGLAATGALCIHVMPPLSGNISRYTPRRWAWHKQWPACLEVSTESVLRLQLGEIRLGKFVDERQSHAGMLEHVLERQVLDEIIRRVDVVVRVLERRLDHKRGRVTGLGGRGMVGAGVAALGLYEGNIAVLRRED